MTEISDDNTHISSSYSPTVGERLRLAREAKKISIAEVVAQLRLTKENVVYLESDQWDKLHGRPYARGYFSNYVNFLGLPHAEMLALFNLEYSSTEPSIDGFRRSEVNTQTESTGWLKSLILIVVLVAAAWFGYQYWMEIQEQTQQAGVTADSILPDIENEQTFGDSFGSSIVEPLPVIEGEQITIVESEEAMETYAPVERASGVDTLLTEEESSIQSEQPNVLEGDDEITLNAGEQEIVTETRTFVMQFAKDCWVEITDQNSKKLLHRMALAGETIDITGEWPLDVLLGNAAAVTARYNNAEFDIASYARANIARFSVGDATE